MTHPCGPHARLWGCQWQLPISAINDNQEGMKQWQLSYHFE